MHYYHDQIVTMARAYLEAAIFTDTTEDNGTDFVDDMPKGGWTIYDFDAQSYDLAMQLCKDFIKHAIEDHQIDFSDTETARQAGYDLWLSRNGHGSGFFDRDQDVYGGQAVNDALQDMAESYGEQALEINAAGDLCFFPCKVCTRAQGR